VVRGRLAPRRVLVVMSSRSWLPFVAVFASACAALGSGCGGTSVQSLCDQICECEGCDDSAQACLHEYTAIREKSEENGCGDDLQGFLDCASEHLECKDKEASFESGCSGEIGLLLSCAGNVGK
jgi:hypothetical protein